MVTPDTMDRLVCAKYLYQTGVETLTRGGPFSSGLAVLSFHDAVELALRAIAAKVHARISDSTLFGQLIDQIDGSGSARVPNRAELFQLNRARNSFKHGALPPRDEDARKFRGDLEVFFTASIPLFFDITFDSISMVRLVRHLRTANWLLRAEEQLNRGEFGLSVESAAKAMAVFLASRKDVRRRVHIESDVRASSPRSSRNSPPAPPELGALTSATHKEFEVVWDRLEQMALGIDLAEYRRFSDIVPTVNLSVAGTFWVSHSRDYDDVPYEQALTCMRFAVQTILRIQDQYVGLRFTVPEERRFRVVSKTPIIFRPTDDDAQNEILIMAESGQILSSPNGRQDQPKAGYTAVLIDGDVAYIRTDCVVADTSQENASQKE